MKKISKKLPYFAFLLLFALLAYFASIFWRSRGIYKYVTGGHKGWIGSPFVYDPQLGFANRPDAVTKQIFPLGPSVPLRHDRNGFRIPMDGNVDLKNPARPLVLALGCSFTYGNACPAESTYTYLLSQLLNGTAINAGLCSSGLSQTLLLAEKLIPRYRPDFTVVQYSPWLLDRAISGFAPTYFGLLPAPYFAPDENGVLKIQPPPFPAVIFRLPVEDYFETKSNIANLISFYFRVGIPLYVYDDLHLFWFRLNETIGLKPERAFNQRLAVVQYVFTRIAQLCAFNNSTLVINIITDEPTGEIESEIEEVFNHLSGAIIVNSSQILADKLPEKTTYAYDRQFRHWRGHPPRLIDKHPNPYTHQIIAEGIFNAIKNRSNLVF